MQERRVDEGWAQDVDTDAIVALGGGVLQVQVHAMTLSTAFDWSGLCERASYRDGSGEANHSMFSGCVDRLMRGMQERCSEK